LKKLCLCFVVVLIILGSIFLLVSTHSDKLITDYSHRAVNLLLAKKNFQGISIEQLSFANAKLNSLDTIVWHDVAAELTLKSQNKIFSGERILVHLDDLMFRVENIISHKMKCSVIGVTARASAIDHASSLGNNAQQFDSLTDGKASMQFELNFFNRDVAIVQLKNILHELKGLLVLGRSKYPLTLTAVISFRVRGENIKALLSIEQVGGEYIIVLNKESVTVLSLLFEEKLTDPEVELLSRNPFRIPQLSRIKDEAQSVSEKAHEKYNLVPEDAYRHILWSYLLTREYGPEFAQKVTDAHEQGVTDNTEAEHRMDYTNNKIGRQYASRKYTKSEILSQLLRDNKVVWKAE